MRDELPYARHGNESPPKQAPPSPARGSWSCSRYPSHSRVFRLIGWTLHISASSNSVNIPYVPFRKMGPKQLAVLCPYLFQPPAFGRGRASHAGPHLGVDLTRRHPAGGKINEPTMVADPSMPEKPGQ